MYGAIALQQSLINAIQSRDRNVLSVYAYKIFVIKLVRNTPLLFFLLRVHISTGFCLKQQLSAIPILSNITGLLIYQGQVL